MYSVYRNLRRGGYSIRNAENLVCCHAEMVKMVGHFVVRDSGRRQVLRSGVKNVHAFVRGILLDVMGVSYKNRGCMFDGVSEWSPGLMREAYYNPRLYSTFIDRLSGEPLTTGPFFVLLNHRGVFYAS